MRLRPRTRAGWVVVILLVANEIRGLVVVAALWPVIKKGILE